MGCGKDSAIDYLRSKGYTLLRREAKDELHRRTRAMTNLTEKEYFTLYELRPVKEEPLTLFRIHYTEYLKLVAILPSCGGRVSMCDKWINLLTSTEIKVPLSIREAMIYQSEVVCKPLYGKDFFGVHRADSLKDGFYYVDGSTGFVEELPPLVDRLGMDNIKLVRIHVDGQDFASNDSRGYIPDGVIRNTIDVENNGTLQEFLDKMLFEFEDFINRG